MYNHRMSYFLILFIVRPSAAHALRKFYLIKWDVRVRPDHTKKLAVLSTICECDWF